MSFLLSGELAILSFMAACSQSVSRIDAPRPSAIARSYVCLGCKVRRRSGQRSDLDMEAPAFDVRAEDSRRRDFSFGMQPKGFLDRFDAFGQSEQRGHVGPRKKQSAAIGDRGGARTLREVCFGPTADVLVHWYPEQA